MKRVCLRCVRAYSFQINPSLPSTIGASCKRIPTHKQPEKHNFFQAKTTDKKRRRRRKVFFARLPLFVWCLRQLCARTLFLTFINIDGWNATSHQFSLYPDRPSHWNAVCIGQSHPSASVHLYTDWRWPRPLDLCLDRPRDQHRW